MRLAQPMTRFMQGDGFHVKGTAVVPLKVVVVVYFTPGDVIFAIIVCIDEIAIII